MSAEQMPTILAVASIEMTAWRAKRLLAADIIAAKTPGSERLSGVFDP